MISSVVWRSDDASFSTSARRSGARAMFLSLRHHSPHYDADIRILTDPSYPVYGPGRIDFAKLTRMTRWMYATGQAVADGDKMPVLVPNFKLDRCRDVTGDYCRTGQ
jgi:hypothetical protein